MSNPYKLALAIALVLSVVVGLGIWYFTSLGFLWIYLVTVTLITFCLYGFDKHQSINGKTRIPEIILHFLSLIGGMVGAFSGMILFRHKTRKLQFKLVFLAIALIQTGLALWWYLIKNAP